MRRVAFFVGWLCSFFWLCLVGQLVSDGHGCGFEGEDLPNGNGRFPTAHHHSPS
jgi:hypothetical protein